MPDTMMNEVMEEYRPVHSFTASRGSKSTPAPPTNNNIPIITLMKSYNEEQKYAGTPLES